MSKLLSMILCLCAVPVLAGGAAEYDPSFFGVNGLKLIHERSGPKPWERARATAKVMKDAGIQWDRLELWWGVIEPEQGKFDWSWADEVAKFYREQKLDAMVILCYTSAWADGIPPVDEAERARYANYVYQVVNRYKDTFKVWEIWNEPNIPNFWKNPNAKDYTLMLQEAYKAAKRADPDCTVLAACTSGADLDFIRGIKDNGGWDYCDAISIHPYSLSGGPIPQRLDRILRITQDYIASTGKPKPLWITEMGWCIYSESLLQPQAIYLFQSYITALANGVEKLLWFDLLDWEEKWGIVKSIDPLEVKPSYEAYRTLTRHLLSEGKAARFTGYLKAPEGVAAYVFRRADGQRVLVAWSNDRVSREFSLPKQEGLSAEDIFGKQVDVNDGAFTVGAVPVVVTGAKRLGIASPRFNPYIAEERENLLVNGSLDIIHGSKPGWWSAGRFDGSAKDGKFDVADGRTEGSKCVSISKSGKRGAWDAVPIPVVAGREYTLTAWMKSEDATGNNQIALYWYSGNLWTYRSEVRSESLTGTDGWTKVTVTGTAPANASLVRVNLISEENTGTVWFDDLVLREK